MPDDPPPKLDSGRISELLAQLHAANERFTHAREHLERMLASNEFDHYRDRDAVEAEIRSTNAEEAISAKIHELLDPAGTDQGDELPGREDG